MNPKISQTLPVSCMPPVSDTPRYLSDTYWWAYVHPAAVKVFERQWLVNAILWGNFARLRDLALNQLGGEAKSEVFCEAPTEALQGRSCFAKLV